MAFNIGNALAGMGSFTEGWKAMDELVKSHQSMLATAEKIEGYEKAKALTDAQAKVKEAMALDPTFGVDPDAPKGTTGSGTPPGTEVPESIISSFNPSETGIGHVAPKSERIAYYTDFAKQLGLNPDAIIMTIDKEGLHKYTGDNGKSFGDFQLYTGGGMGNLALDAGINVRDPKTWKEQGKFVLEQMAAHKGDTAWFGSQWHGPRNFAPWAVNNFSNPNVAPPKGRYASAPAAVAAPVAPSALGGGDYPGEVAAPAPASALAGAPTVTSTAPAPPPPPMTAPGPPTGSLPVPQGSQRGGSSATVAPGWQSNPALARTQQQQYQDDIAAGRRPIFPPGTKFNSRGEAISPDLSRNLKGQQSGPNYPRPQFTAGSGGGTPQMPGPGAGGNPYNTQLPPAQESAFRAWVKNNKVKFNPDQDMTDYDMRGFWAAQQQGDRRAQTQYNPDANEVHYPDIWKTPIHKTFSNDSQYAPPGAPRWEGGRLISQDGTVLVDETAGNALGR